MIDKLSMLLNKPEVPDGDMKLFGKVFDRIEKNADGLAGGANVLQCSSSWLLKKCLAERASVS